MIELALVLSLASSNDLLEKCKTESQALNTARTIATCTAAGDDVNQSKPDRVEALKLLGMALMVEGDADLAENAFVKMLTLDPQATLGSDAGPNVQKVLALAHAKVEANPPATPPTTTTTPPPTTTPPSTPQSTPQSTTVGGLPKSTIGWTAAGAGGAFALASAAVIVAASWDYYFDRVKCGSNGAECIPFKPMLFGLYSADKRSDFFDAGPFWIAGAGVAFAVGAGAAGAGVFVATSSAE
jgi:hypothetical protein